MSKVKNKFFNNLHWFIVGGVAILCALFLFFGHTDEKGYVTLTGGEVTITETTKKFIEDSQAALYRIMNEDAPTDEATIEANNEDEVGLGFYTTIDDILNRRLPDGDTDGGRGWQCSKYTAYLATGKREYSAAHPDYGPVNGKDVAAYLVKNYGFKYVDQPVAGAIGSGGFNTLYGHTVMFLYSTGTNTAMVNDANYSPLAVATHNMNISDYVWVVPGNYNPQPTPTPTPTPTPVNPDHRSGDKLSYTYVKGDYFSKVLVSLGLDEGNLWGANGTVRYYTSQLIEQNMLDSRGNVFIGVPFTLTVK